MPVKNFSTRVCAIAILATGVTVAAVALPASAGAKTVVTHSSSAAVVGGQHLALPATPVTTHQFLAGWYSPTPGGLTSASAKFKAPSITCPTSDTMDYGIGVFAVPDAGDLEHSSQAAVQLVCGDLGGIYITAYAPGQGLVAALINPGDLVITTLTEDGTTTVATAYDVTQDITVTSSGPSAFDTAENTGSYNYEHPGPIPTFAGRVNLARCRVNGAPLEATATQRLNLEGGTDVQVSTTNLNQKTGDKFGQVFKHAA